MIIESSVIGLELIFEHRNYLPSMFLILMVVMPVDRYIRSPGAKAGLLAAVALVLCIWTHDRNDVWRDPVALWRDCAAKSPRKARPHNNLGAAYDDLGKIDRALYHYREALKFDPNLAGAHNNLDTALAMRGDLDAAIGHFSEALQIDPDDAQTHSNQGNALASLGKYEEAIKHYRAALAVDPSDEEVLRNLAKARKRMKK